VLKEEFGGGGDSDFFEHEIIEDVVEKRAKKLVESRDITLLYEFLTSNPLDEVLCDLFFLSPEE